MSSRPVSKGQVQTDIRRLSDLLRSYNTDTERFDKATALVMERPHLAAARAFYPKGDEDHDSTGTPFLNLAAGIGAFDCVKALVEAGAPLEGRSPKGRTPLLDAIDTGAGRFDASLTARRHQIYQYLVSQGARADVVDNTGANPIYHCCGDLDIDIARDLIRRGTPLNDSWYMHESQRLIPSITSMAGCSAWCEPGSNRRETFELLVRSGVELNPAIRHIGDHPLAAALAKDALDAADLMVQHGARWQTRAPDGQSLMFAAETSNAVQWLLDKDPALLEQPDQRGRTPLLYHVASVARAIPGSLASRIDVVSALILAGANLDAVDDQGPLLCETPRQLIAHGSNRALQEFFRSFQASRVADEALAGVRLEQGVRP